MKKKTMEFDDFHELLFGVQEEDNHKPKKKTMATKTTVEMIMSALTTTAASAKLQAIKLRLKAKYKEASITKK